MFSFWCQSYLVLYLLGMGSEFGNGLLLTASTFMFLIVVCQRIGDKVVLLLCFNKDIKGLGAM